MKNLDDAFVTLFENNNWIIVDKPAQYLSVPSRLGEKESRPCLGLILQKRLGVQLFPIHRLDFEVSGILIFAKNPEAHRLGNMIFENRRVTKTYRAISIPDETKFRMTPGQSGIWESRILRGKKRAYESPVGKDSKTQFKVIEETESPLGVATVWDLIPITGRSHQLRFEMYRNRNPILGDKLYGGRELGAGFKGICLRAYRLELEDKVENYLGLPKEILVSSNFSFSQ